MNNYKEMYFTLFNKITDVIRELESIQSESEEAFLSQDPEQNILQIHRKEKHE